MNQISAKTRQILSLLLCILSGACGGSALVHLALALDLTDVIHYGLYFKPSVPAVWYISGIATGAAAGFAGAKKYSHLLLPFLLLLPGIFFRNSFSILLLAVATAAVLGFQVGRYHPVPDKFFRKQWCLPLIALLFTGAVYSGVIYQEKAFYALHFQYNDWAEYAESYLRAPLASAACGHWNILPNLIGHALLKIHPAPQALFILNSLLISSSIPLAAYLALVCKLKWRGAMFFAVITALLPVFTHQHLCSFYGYHPVVFLIIPGLLFFVFEEKKNLPGMLFCTAIMLLIQETSAILLAGYGLYLLTENKKRLAGVVTVLLGIILFRLLSGLSNPGEIYGQAGRYHHLGVTTIAILLSPFLNPAAFWSTVFDSHTIFFAAVLFLPPGLAILPRLRGILIIIPVLAGILLQNYSSSKTVASQYGLEITICLLGLAITSTGKVRQRKFKLPRPADISSARYVPAMLCALLFSSAAAYCFWGHSFFIGKWNFAGKDAAAGKKIIRRLGNLPDMEPVYEQLCRVIPADARLLASQRIRSRLVFRNKTFPIYAPRLPGDVIVIDLDDIFPTAGIRKELFESANVHLINFINYRGTRLLVYRVSPPGVHKSPLPFLRQGNSAPGNSGIKLAENQHFDIRITAITQNTHLSVKVKKPPEKDTEFIFSFSGKKDTVFPVRFAHGALPANAAKQGQFFLFQLPVKEFRQVRVQINPLQQEF